MKHVTAGLKNRKFIATPKRGRRRKSGQTRRKRRGSNRHPV